MASTAPFHHPQNKPKTSCDSALIIDITRLFSSSARSPIFAPSQIVEPNQPHAPKPTAVLLSCRPTFLQNLPPNSRHSTLLKTQPAVRGGRQERPRGVMGLGAPERLKRSGRPELVRVAPEHSAPSRKRRPPQRRGQTRDSGAKASPASHVPDHYRKRPRLQAWCAKAH